MIKKLKIFSTFLLVFLFSFSSSFIAFAYLGKESSSSQKGPLEKTVYIHYKKNLKKEGKGRKSNSCYGFLSKDAKWKKLPTSIIINPENSDGLDGEFIKNAVIVAGEEWDGYVETELFSEYELDDTADWDNDIPDRRNEISFGDYPQSNVIAVAVVWGYFSGSPQLREIIEFDILLDTDFTWGDAESNSSLMDVQNIVTHEIGHGIGLNDIYKTQCSEETMYGYSQEGEIKKRDLYFGDILGIQKLYGI